MIAWTIAHGEKLLLWAVEFATVIANMAGMIYAGIVAAYSSLGPAGFAVGIALAAAVVGGVIAAASSFAEGGVAVGPQLAMVGDNPGGREAIIPLERLPGLLSGGGGSQHFDLILDGRTLSRATVRGQPGYVRLRLGGR